MKTLQTPFFRIKEQSLQYDISLLKQSLADNWGNYIGVFRKNQFSPMAVKLSEKRGILCRSGI